jgi:hypothetical protein
MKKKPAKKSLFKTLNRLKLNLNCERESEGQNDLIYTHFVSLSHSRTAFRRQASSSETDVKKNEKKFFLFSLPRQK